LTGYANFIHHTYKCVPYFFLIFQFCAIAFYGPTDALKIYINKLFIRGGHMLLIFLSRKYCTQIMWLKSLSILGLGFRFFLSYQCALIILIFLFFLFFSALWFSMVYKYNVCIEDRKIFRVKCSCHFHVEIAIVGVNQVVTYRI